MTVEKLNFFEQPILNSPYAAPTRHHELENGVPTNTVIPRRRKCDLISPYPKPKRTARAAAQLELGASNQDVIEGEAGLNYALTEFVNTIRSQVDSWRALSNPRDWQVSPTTQRLLLYWRTHGFQGIRPFYCQLEAVETLIWLSEAAPKTVQGRRVIEQIAHANTEANPGLLRIAMKLATGAGKTTVMAMLIAWQTLNAVRTPGSSRYSRGFLIVAPGLTIRDRLNVLRPEDSENYYDTRELVPLDMRADVKKAIVVITNYHAFKRRETLELSKGTRRALAGREGTLSTKETEGEMVRRIAPELMGLGPIIALNDEAHHCYRERPDGQEQTAAANREMSREEKDQAKAAAEAARVWISGLEAFNRVLAKDHKHKDRKHKGRSGGLIATYDLSATPFFLQGSGYVEGTLFPWVVSDFSLMDAIECGIVKLPRMPVADNTVDADVPKFRELWRHIRDGPGLPKGSRGAAHAKSAGDPQQLPVLLQTALENLYGHYQATFEAWAAAGAAVPPALIIVCNNTATSKLVYDFIAGYEKYDAHGAFAGVEPGKFPLLSNFNTTTNSRHSRARTLLVDSYQLESGEEIDKDFRSTFAAEIDQFRREVAQREGAGAAEKISDTDILREGMNTVGKAGKLGAGIRCVVSVAMLTEGWDANNVTHILGVRAFGTQLLCEQVVGRGLRRASYELNEAGLFDVEYAEVLGIPFAFTSAQPIRPTAPQAAPKTHVTAMAERAGLAISFPRLVGYRKQLPTQQLVADFSEDSRFVLSPEKVGPGEVDMAGIVGEEYILRAHKTSGDRPSELIYWLTKTLLDTRFKANYADETPVHLFPAVKRIVRQWYEGYFSCVGGVRPRQILIPLILHEVCDLIFSAIGSKTGGAAQIKPLLDPYRPQGSSAEVGFYTRQALWRTAPNRCHINYCVLDSDWEGECCRALEGHGAVRAYVKNHNLGFEVPYQLHGQQRAYRPDFIVRVDDGRGQDDLLNLIIEIKGYRDGHAAKKAETMRTLWLPAVNASGAYGRWAFAEFQQPFEIVKHLHETIDAAIRQGGVT